MSSPVLYLASRSPRRQALLRQLDLEFEPLLLREAAGRERDVVEQTLDAEPAAHYVERMARTKAQVGWQRMQDRKLAERPVLGADTEVILDGEVLGKPRDIDDALWMLKRLSGRTHQVLSAIALRWREQTEVEISVSKVTLRRLTAAEVERYVATGEPMDKAGAYAIQGRAAAFVTRLEGSYTGVVGLPLAETATLLARVGVCVL
ncbi:MAG: septum formation inhibitor Maf [Betaproteobacteria bacterium]|nr:septum formation inhibitor Maf [Betaproteobacteria bacterium]MDE2002643.1 septum formation inhibitor Maf [Betaproteobacteria bacterium]MDE2209533.1 septum formation inhibitor Maf [Betaproteobacteria bacterium]